MTGKFLRQGLRAPNYVYEPLDIFGNDIKILNKWLGLKQAPSYFAEKFREELMNVFLTGRPNEKSFHASLATSGINVTDGGDVITKTIRMRYAHLKGWVEDQESFKVNQSTFSQLSFEIFLQKTDFFKRLFILFGIHVACWLPCYAVNQLGHKR